MSHANVMSPHISHLLFGAALLGSVSFGAESPKGGVASRLESNPVVWSELSNQAFLVLPPMLGHVASGEARIWAAASRSSVLSVRVGREESLTEGDVVEGPALEEKSGWMGHVRVGGLSPETTYYYCLMLDGRPAMLRPYPSFTTAPAEGQPGRVRFGFTSCVGYRGYLASAGYADMARTNMDLLLMTGDNHYADTNDVFVQRRFYADQRRTAGWAGLAPRTPIYAVWDDHDFGPNNSDGRLKGKEQSLQAFQEAWANPAYGEPDNPGVYFKFQRRDVEFYMLDGRYHRDPNTARNLERKTMLGARQLDWLKRGLKASTASIKVLVCGGEWQTHGTDDSWTSFKEERDEIFRFIEDNKISGILLISGDRHFTGAYQVRGKWIEVTAGPLGSGTAVVKNSPEMFLNLSETKGRYYCVYDLDTAASPIRVTLEIYRVGEGLARRREFNWDEVLGTRPIPALPPSPKAETKAPGDRAVAPAGR